MIQMATVKKGETNMAYPFEPLSTEKLKIYFKKMIDQNCNNKESNQGHENGTNESRKNRRFKRRRSDRVIETWVQRQINS